MTENTLPMDILVLCDEDALLYSFRPVVRLVPGKLSSFLKLIVCRSFIALIGARCEPLSKQTQYSNLGLELFLPSVRKGVITGYGASLWHCLAFGTRVCNCDSRPLNDKTFDIFPLHQHCTSLGAGILLILTPGIFATRLNTSWTEIFK